MAATPTLVQGPVTATCHCGAVSIQAPRLPDEINECQCTLCRRYGAAWAYYAPKDVSITTKSSLPTRKYIWGDRMIEFHFCSGCGCVTHWLSIEEGPEVGVNTRMMDPEAIKYVNRKVDYTVLLTPLKSAVVAHLEDTR